MKCHLSLRGLVASCLACIACSAAQGEVSDSSAAGFSVKFEVMIDAAPAEIYGNLVNKIADWWHPDHTYSGDSANFIWKLEKKAGSANDCQMVAPSNTWKYCTRPPTRCCVSAAH